MPFSLFEQRANEPEIDLRVQEKEKETHGTKSTLICSQKDQFPRVMECNGLNKLHANVNLNINSMVQLEEILETTFQMSRATLPVHYMLLTCGGSLKHCSSPPQ